MSSYLKLYGICNTAARAQLSTSENELRWTCLADPSTAAYSSTTVLLSIHTYIVSSCEKPSENTDDTTVDLYNYANVIGYIFLTKSK